MHVPHLLLAAVLASPTPVRESPRHEDHEHVGVSDFADVFFVGKAVSVRPSLLDPFAARVVRLEVVHVWKGDVGAEQAVVLADDCDDGGPLDGRTWLVVASRNGWGRLEVYGCLLAAERRGPRQWFYEAKPGQWMRLDDIPGWVDELGAGHPPYHNAWPERAGWVLLAAAVAGPWALARRRRWRDARA